MYTVEYCSAIERNTFESVLVGWMKLEPIVQSEVGQGGERQCSVLALFLNKPACWQNQYNIVKLNKIK